MTVDWDGIVRDHGPAVWRTAHRLLANRADADECFQETFAAAVQVVRRQNEPVRQWNALLVRLATARAIDRLRQRVRRSSREGAAGDEIDVMPDRDRHARPPQRAEQAEMAQRLRTALSRLPAKQADAFCLHCLEGWSYREVGEHLGATVDHVGVLISRARAQLREQIGYILSSSSDDQNARGVIQSGRGGGGGASRDVPGGGRGVP
jgi:RNA polymerase sigma-70 factor, ECF subfamily